MAENIASGSRNIYEQAFQLKRRAGVGRRFCLGGDVTLDFVQVPEEQGAFWMGCFPVTQGQYESVVGENPSRYKMENWARHPVERVTWYEAMAFCDRLNEILVSEKGESVFTLPTVAQWKTAAFAGEKTRYAGSDKLDEVGWYSGNAGSYTHEVGLLKPNGFGLYDMSGNVWEWCLDRDMSFSGEVCYPIRGGGWYNDETCCRIDYHYSNTPTYHFGCFGFRVIAYRGQPTG